MQFSNKFQEILQRIGLTDEAEINKFLFPSRDGLSSLDGYSGFAEAKERIERAILNNEKIVIYGDYDCDGVCAVAIMYDYLVRRGADVSYFIPDRHRDGYGINMEQMEMIATNYFPDLVITVDCGISAAEEIRIIEEDMGIDVIVTDHHEPQEVLPPCIVIDAKCDKGVFSEYSGGGIAYRLVEYISGSDVADRYLDIAAISTIGDIVSLREDNRIIAALGLKAIASTKRLGLRLMLDSIGRNNSPVSSYDVAFKIVPRINSAGRLGDAGRVVDLFLSDDYFLMSSLVEELNRINEERQRMTDKIVEEAMDMLADYDVPSSNAIVLHNKKWDSGIIGIAASRLVNLFARPVILLAGEENNVYKGSCRSVEGVNLYEELSRCRDLLIAFGGHKMACGLSIDESCIDKLRKRLNGILLPDTYARRGDRLISVDKEDITPSFARELELLEPFGQDNKEILFEYSAKRLKFAPFGDGTHIKCKVNKDFEIVYFGGADRVQLLESDTDIKYTLKLKYNVYNNYDYVQGSVVGIDYELDNSFDDTKAVAAYVKNLLRGKESVFKIEKYSRELLEKMPVYGNFIIASCIESFNRFYNENKEYIKAVGYDMVDEVNPVNRLVLGLNVNNDMRYYDNLIFIDDIRHYNVVDYMKLNGACRVFTNGNVNDIINRIKMPSYDIFGKIFIAIRKLNAVNRYGNNMDIIYRDVAGYYGGEISYLDFTIAFCTFFDLGLLSFKNGKLMVNDGVSTKLDNSKFYTELKELIKNGYND